MNEAVSPRFSGPLPPHDEVSIDLVEATVWQLLAGRQLHRNPTDVAWLIGLIQRYAEAYAVRLQRDGMSATAGYVTRQHQLMFSDQHSVSAAILASAHNDELRRQTGSEVIPESTDVIPDGLKKCATCSEMLPLTEFYASGTHKDGRRSSCKRCSREHRRVVRQRLNAARAKARQDRILGE